MSSKQDGIIPLCSRRLWTSPACPLPQCYGHESPSLAATTTGWVGVGDVRLQRGTIIVIGNVPLSIHVHAFI